MSGERGPPSSPCFGPHGTGSTGFWMRSGMKKFRRKYWKGKLRTILLPRFRKACQTKRPMPTFGTMRLVAIFIATLFLRFSLVPTASAQTPPPEPSRSPDAVQLEALAKKIDEQNAKIDALSQQILKLEEQ